MLEEILAKNNALLLSRVFGNSHSEFQISARQNFARILSNSEHFEIQTNETNIFPF